MTATDTGPGTDLRTLFTLVGTGADVATAVDAVITRHDRDRARYLGFPVAHDLDFPHTRRLLAAGFFNNISTEQHWPPGGQHAMEAEIAVLDWLSDLFGIDRGRRWGYATTGGSGGNRAGLRHARALHPDATVVYSTGAHYSVDQAIRDFRMQAAAVPADRCGAIDLDAFDSTIVRLAAEQADAAVVVVATAGTTLTEASDDLPAITAVLDTHGIRRRYVHVDGALAGVPLALDQAIDLSGTDSVSVSGYKFLAVPEACGMVLGRRRDTDSADGGEVVAYTDTVNATETGVRSGLFPAMMFEAIAQHGRTGHRARAHASRAVADHLIARLHQIGVTAWRNPSAYFTVVLATPPAAVLGRWTLGTNDAGTSRIVCVPGVTVERVDAFVDDYTTALKARTVPRQRRSTADVGAQ